MINNQYYQKRNFFLWDTMEHCSHQCIRRTLYAIIIGISPIVICLLLIGIIRLILNCLEIIYYRRQKPTIRRRPSSIFYRAGRPTLSYTPVSIIELQRIIQGDYQSQQQSQSSLSIQNDDNDSPKSSKFMKSLLTRHESTVPLASNTLANLVIRRNAINSNPYTALIAPVSQPVTPTFKTINERRIRRPSSMTIRRESIETTTSSIINNNNNNNSNIFFDTNDLSEYEQTDTDPLLTSPTTMTTTTTTTTVVVEEFLDFHSVHSVPCSLNLVGSIIEEDF